MSVTVSNETVDQIVASAAMLLADESVELLDDEQADFRECVESFLSKRGITVEDKAASLVGNG